MLTDCAMRHLERIRSGTDRAGFMDRRESTKGIQRQPSDIVPFYHDRKTNNSAAFLTSQKHLELLDFMGHVDGGKAKMAYSFSNSENVSTRQLRASGIDQEAIYRIRNQGRIERAKIIRQCFATLKRFATAAYCGGGSHEPSNHRRASI
ncbi:hypothetical protein [Mesorhizobium xinjiangense]|uniref:hypothetical protein n=1 Tax=Mesorhizobium xinjiangense TaxID=2678685 RepID=UPI0018DC8956|nr:hypothetical protein [Mesorhizobium xinjiangense]